MLSRVSRPVHHILHGVQKNALGMRKLDLDVQKLLATKSVKSHQYLLDKGFVIRERNWRYRHAEVDIIAEKDGILVFCEVKTRSNSYYGEPGAFVTERKEQLLVDAASKYMSDIDYSWEFRFDIISILAHNKEVKSIVHYEDAFFPGI